MRLVQGGEMLSVVVACLLPTILREWCSCRIVGGWGLHGERSLVAAAQWGTSGATDRARAVTRGTGSLVAGVKESRRVTNVSRT